MPYMFNGYHDVIYKPPKIQVRFQLNERNNKNKCVKMFFSKFIAKNENESESKNKN